jgi:LAO/AO transport system kinase
MPERAMPDRAMLDALFERLRGGERRALARLLTLAGRGELGGDESARFFEPGLNKDQKTAVIAVTGSPGVGKSTLVGGLVRALRGRGRRVAVLACDPQSPRTGGALLGDRCRMPSDVDDGIFIRSLATPGGQGAVAPHLDIMIRLLEAFGFDTILLETVGAGQGDTAVNDLADVVVVLVQPESGDELQWEKAGLLEIADVVVVHKADLPGAEQTAAHARNTLDLVKTSGVPVVSVSSKTGAGMAELLHAVHTEPERQRP